MKTSIGPAPGAVNPWGVQLEVGVASGAALANCSRTITALLECGDLSPPWPGPQNESGDKSPHSIADSSFVFTFARIPRQPDSHTPGFSRFRLSRRTILWFLLFSWNVLLLIVAVTSNFLLQSITAGIPRIVSAFLVVQ